MFDKITRMNEGRENIVAALQESSYLHEQTT
jgi:hypothetical protein